MQLISAWCAVGRKSKRNVSTESLTWERITPRPRIEVDVLVLPVMNPQIQGSIGPNSGRRAGNAALIQGSARLRRELNAPDQDAGPRIAGQ